MNIPQKVDGNQILICPQCGGTLWLKHIDGKQCYNCMKIVYTHKPISSKGNYRCGPRSRAYED